MESYRASKKVIVKGACYFIGDGSSINIQKDPWVPWIQGFIPTPRNEDDLQVPILVSHLIVSELHSWKSWLVRELFDSQLAQAILSLPLPSRPKLDELIWIPDSKGHFSVKSAYLATKESSLAPLANGINWIKLWKLNAPERIKMLLWRIEVNALPTRENLMTKMHIEDPNCVFYKQEIENLCHVFFRCPASKAIWFSTCQGLRTERIVIAHPEDIVKLVLDPPSGFEDAQQQWQTSLIMALTIKETWKSRNNALQHNAVWDVTTSSQHIQHKFYEFSLVSPYTNPPLPMPTTQHWSPPPPCQLD